MPEEFDDIGFRARVAWIVLTDEWEAAEFFPALEFECASWWERTDILDQCEGLLGCAVGEG